MMKRAIGILAAVALLLGGAGRARAGFQVFALTWSGAAYGNNARATGEITFDPALLANPGSNVIIPQSFSITVSGAGAGNGTYTQADFSRFDLDTNGGKLDFTRELVGQATSGGPWGSRFVNGQYQNAGNQYSGDFNIVSNLSDPTAPSGTNPFQLVTNFSPEFGIGSGDLLTLTSFAPEGPSPAAVPEPASLTLLGIGIASLAGYGWRRRKPTATA